MSKKNGEYPEFINYVFHIQYFLEIFAFSIQVIQEKCYKRSTLG